MSTAPRMVVDQPLPRVRRCAQCGAPDQARVDLVDGAPVAEHTVRLEIRYIDRAEDREDAIRVRRLLARGWRKVTVQGRAAVERFCCTNCLNANELSGKVWAGLKRQARALEEKNKHKDNYYHLLCDVEEAQ